VLLGLAKWLSFDLSLRRQISRTSRHAAIVNFPLACSSIVLTQKNETNRFASVMPPEEKTLAVAADTLALGSEGGALGS
jgi:hypothetical protein